MVDCLIVGGGVIGLSLALELAESGAAVRVIDRGEPAREASWAAAGILPPIGDRRGKSPFEQLAALSDTLQPIWAERLRTMTGVDTGYRVCGGIHFACDEPNTEALRQRCIDWREHGVTCEDLTRAEVQRIEPGLSGGGPMELAIFLPAEAQLRPPWHTKALLAALRAKGVEISSGVSLEDVRLQNGRFHRAMTSAGEIEAGRLCIACGAWSPAVASRVGVELAIRPIRGQIVMLAPSSARLSRVVYEGSKYFTPREDGRVLVGSTLEDVGFEKRTTAAAVASILNWALHWAPELADAPVEQTWSGFRPCTADGLPYLGAAPDAEGVFVATGHYRAGFELAPGTAVVMRELMQGETPSVSLDAFRLDRDPLREHAVVGS